MIKIRPIVGIGKERLNSTFRLDDSLSKKNFLVKENTRDYVARINLVSPEQSMKCQDMSASSYECLDIHTENTSTCLHCGFKVKCNETLF